MIITSSRWNAQPQIPTGIAGNTLARECIGAFNPAPGYGYYDASQYRNHIGQKSAGGVVKTPSPLGWHYPFTTSDGLVGGTSTPAFDAATGFSIAIWHKFASSPQFYGTILSRDAGTGGDWELANDNVGQYMAYARNGAILFTSAASDANWHFWVCTVDAAGAGVWYRDGVSVATGSGISVRTANGAIRVGRRSDNNPNNGATADFSLFNSALSSFEVALLYRQYAGLLYARLQRRIYVAPAAAVAGSGQRIFGGGWGGRVIAQMKEAA